MNICKIFFFSILFTFLTYAQVLRVSTKIEDDHLAFEEQEELRELPDKINEYYNSFEWTDDEYETDIVTNIYIIIESVRKKSFEKIYKAQFQIKSMSGESFYDQMFEFPYHKGYPLEHNKLQWDPLCHYLDYYAYLILAGELDTYGLLLGTPYYDKALDIANQGALSQYPRGWSLRIKELEKITHIRTRPLREAKPDFFEALYWLEEGNMKETRKYANKVLDAISKVYKEQPNNKYLKLFFDAHYREFAIIFKNNNNALEKLSLYDPNHKDEYRKNMKYY